MVADQHYHRLLISDFFEIATFLLIEVYLIARVHCGENNIVPLNQKFPLIKGLYFNG